MVANNPNRDAHFPLIEKKYGQPMAYWFARMADMSEAKYPEQIAYLREEHGFSQAHANALVMYSRGSKSSRRYDDIDQFLKQFDSEKQETVRLIFKAAKKKYPKSEIVIAWNKPTLRIKEQYVFGVDVLKNHILILPFSQDAILKLAKDLSGYKTNKKTIEVPVDWDVDSKLILAITKERLNEVNN